VLTFVHALVTYEGEVVVGGKFTAAAGGAVSAANVASWNGQRWAALGAGLPGTGVHALLVYGDTLVAAGEFYGGPLQWTGGLWTALGGAGVTQSAFALAAFGGERGLLAVGGVFKTVEETPKGKVRVDAKLVAQWDGAGAWGPLGSGLNNTGPAFCYALAGYDGGLVAGGYFTLAGGEPALNVAFWDGAAWHPLGAGLGESSVLALAVHDGKLVAGGEFWYSGTTYVSGLAVWDGVAWGPLRSVGDYRVLATSLAVL
jgi:hypothetical protein